MSGSAYIDNYSKVIAFWSAKCACTPVDHWFARGVLTLNPFYEDKMESLLDRIDHVDEGSPRLFLGANGFKYDFVDAQKRAHHDEYFVVHFTRHPALRLVSAYLNKFVIYAGRYLNTYDDLEPFAKHLASEIYQRNHWPLALYKGIRFCDLVEHLWSFAQNPRPGAYIDHHWATQIPKGTARGVHIEPDYIVYTERFNEDLRILNSHLGINFVPGKFNVTSFPDAIETDENLTRHFSQDLIKSRILVRPGNLLDRESVQKIKEIYADDYQYFGYSPDNATIPRFGTIKKRQH